MVQFDYHAAYYPIEDGWYLAKALDFPGVVTQGSNLEHARKMLRAALLDMAEWLLEDGLPIPRPDPQAADSNAQVSEPIKLILQLKVEAPPAAAASQKEGGRRVRLSQPEPP